MEAAGDFILSLYNQLGVVGGSVAIGVITLAALAIKKNGLGSLGERFGITSTVVEDDESTDTISSLRAEIDALKKHTNILQCLSLSNLEMSPKGVMLFDSSGETVWVNNRLAIEMCPTGKPQFYGQNWLSLVHSEDRNNLRDNLAMCVEKMSDLKDEHFRMKVNGGYEFFVLNSWITKEDPMNPEVNNLEATGWIVYLHLRDSPPMTNYALGKLVSEMFDKVMARIDDRDQESKAKHKFTRDGVAKLAEGAGLGTPLWPEEE